MPEYTPRDIAIAAGKRLASQVVPMDEAWANVVAEGGIELTDGAGFTIQLENGQRFLVRVTVDQLSAGMRHMLINSNPEDAEHAIHGHRQITVDALADRGLATRIGARDAGRYRLTDAGVSLRRTLEAIAANHLATEEK